MSAKSTTSEIGFTSRETGEIGFAPRETGENVSVPRETGARSGRARGLLALACALLFLAGYFVREFPSHPSGNVLALTSTVAIALPAFLALGRSQGLRAAATLVALLALYAYAIEVVGVLTGFPYGAFEYSAGMGPLAFGLVPVLLPLAYVPLVLGGAAFADRVRPVATRRGRPLTAPSPRACGRPASVRRDLEWVAAGAIFLIAFDLLLDPGAVRLGYWRYAGGGAYYGVPASNYFGWALSGLAAMALVTWRLGPSWRRPALPLGVASSALLLFAFWWGIAFWHGLPVPAVLGAGVAAVALALWVRDRRNRARSGR